MAVVMSVIEGLGARKLTGKKGHTAFADIAAAQTATQAKDT